MQNESSDNLLLKTTRFKVHDLSASRKTNEIYGGLTIAYRFMEDIDKN